MVSRKVDSVKKFFPRFFLISLSVILYSCGGGGGGGGGSSGSGDNSVSSASSGTSSTYFTWQNFHAASDLSTLASIKSNFTDNIRSYHIRKASNDNFCIDKDDNVALDFTLVSLTSFNIDIQFTAASGSGDCAGATVSGDKISISSDKVPAPYYRNFEGFYAGSIERVQDWDIGIVDTNTLTETAFQMNGIFNDVDGVLTYWSGTSYVAPEVDVINYGNTCNYYSDGSCASLNTDDTYETDLITSVEGDITEGTDMPTEAKSYTSKALAVGIYGISNYLNGGSFSSLKSGCGSSLLNDWVCQFRVPYSVSGAHTIAADFSAKTLTGNFTLSKHYILETLQSEITEIFPTTTVTDLVINATISGNSFSGTVSNTDFEGDIIGNFYGPKGTEIGATILITNKSTSTVFPDGNDAFAVIALVGY